MPDAAIPGELQIELLSDTTFAASEAVGGEVDTEVDHDELGLPCCGGKTLRGLLRDSFLSMARNFPELHDAAVAVFGLEGSLEREAILHIGDAQIDADSRAWLAKAMSREENHSLTPRDVLLSLTAIRRQTSEDRSTGAPAQHSLRSSRVVLHAIPGDKRGEFAKLTMFAPLRWSRDPSPLELRCVAMAALATRHAGTSRTRGRGHIRITLNGKLGYTRKLLEEAQ